MSRLAHHFSTMAYNNAWANHRLLAAVSLLDDGELAAARTSFFPSIKATLNHNVTVDWLYVDALERALRGDAPEPRPSRFFEPAEPFATCPALAEAQKSVDARLVALTLSLDDPALDTPVRIVRSTGVATDPVARILAHLFEHQIHHRGQAHAMLAGTSVKPPPLDEFFCTGDAPLRAADFAELGYSETLIWGEGKEQTR